MTNDVKPPREADDDRKTLHTAALVGLVLERFRSSLSPEDWEGLRVSHFRILETLPPDGTRSVEVARLLGMTKQGAGQLLSTLADGGWVEQVPDPDDGRARIVRRTARGERMVARRRIAYERIDRAWSEEVGGEEYARFRAVLERLAAEPVRVDPGRPA